ncbi:MAG: MSMEG_0570 family nitrogen starvation response protein [Elainellaceae cyanobacterium]
MPEIQFKVQWPDGSQEVCYSPSLVVKDYLTAGEVYGLESFVARSRTALTLASERVQQKYGFPCSRALGQLQRIETKAKDYQSFDQPSVQIIEFVA